MAKPQITEHVVAAFVSVLSFRAKSPAAAGLLFLNTEISRDVSRSTRCARSGQALIMAAAPL